MKNVRNWASALVCFGGIWVGTGCGGGSVAPGTSATVRPAITFSISPGTYSSPQTVTISTSSAGAQIYYTTNGTTPTTSSTLYTGPIAVTSSETVEAIAVVGGVSSGTADSATYVISPPTATPVFSLVAGTYPSPQTVTITSATPAAQIFYTVDGTVPTSSSAPITGPITVGSSERLEAFALAPGYSASPVATASYTITAAQVPLVTASLSLTSFTLSSPAIVSVHVSCNSACGQVTLQIDGSPWQAGALDTTGTYSTSAFPSLGVGSHSLEASYAGNGTYAPASSSQVGFTVTAASTGSPHAVLSTNFLEYAISGVTKDVTLSNTGSAALLVRGIGTYTSYFTEADNCGSSLASGASCTISVTDRTPTAGYLDVPDSLSNAGWRDQLTIMSNDSTSTAGVALQDSGNDVQVLKSNLAFGSTVIGTPAQGNVSVLTTSSLGCSAAISGTDFAVSAPTILSSQSYPFEYLPQQCLYTVTFTPSAAGKRTGALLLGTDGSYIPLLGVGEPSTPVVSNLSPSSLSLHDFSGTQNATLSNYGSTTMNIQAVSVSSGFSQTNTCGASLPAQSVCTVTISSLQPAIPQGIQGLLTVADDAGTQSIQLVGTIGQIQQLGSWPVGASSPVVNYPFVGVGENESGADPGDFPTSLVKVAEGAVEPTVVFKPVDLGQRTASLSIQLHYGTQIVPADFLLIGNGLPPAGSGPLITVTPPAAAAIPLGQSTFLSLTINNAGTTTLAFDPANSMTTSGGDAGDFTASSGDQCASTLQPGKQCVYYTVKFAPSATGTRTTNLVITDSTSGQSFSFPLSATGTPAGPVANPPSFIPAQLGTSTMLSIPVTSPAGDPVAAYVDSVELGSAPSAFTFTKSTCSQGESPCLITMKYAPTTTTNLQVPVVFVDTVTGSSLKLSLTGTIAPGTLTITPSSIGFGTRSVNTVSLPQAITLTATNGTDYLFAPAVSGANASEFPITTNCGSTLSDGSCTIDVSFAPVSPGSKSATVLVNYGNGQTLTTTVTGTAQ